MVDTISRVAPMASATAGTFAPAGWQQAIDNVLAHGSYSVLAPFPPTMRLQKITGPKDGTHTDGIVSDWGSYPQSAGDARASLQSLIGGWAKYQPTIELAANDDQERNDAARAEAARRAAQEIAPVIRQPNGITFPRTSGAFRLRQ